MIKEAAKKKVAELVERFRVAERSGVVKRYTESDTKKNLIEPLFAALGWPIDTDDVRMEESISGDRVDYGFYIDGRIQFYLEAKAIKADLSNEKFANQAVKYSWNKGVAWAVLTDFEEIKIFNAQDIDASLASKRFKTIRWDEYIDRFDELWLLSRVAWQEKLLDAEAEKSGKKLERVSVTTRLYEDLNEARTILSETFFRWNKDLQLDPSLLDEGVQKVLDRIIFIRVAEDRGIEPPTLRPLVREWSANWYEKQKRDKYLYQSMEEKFRELDAIYNSNIFAKHPSDEWVDEKNTLQEITEKFYGKEDYYEYDFKIIPADILGTVYEQYLGHKLTKAGKGDLFGTEDLKVAKSARKRKEQGIYYTPRFIVDYITENTLGPVLKKCESITDLQKIKILDPACGSGSFLIKALELIYKRYEELGSTGQYVKLQILTNNLYGVDLDEQAVEIARLNLLVAALEERMKMPDLDNIRVGNSLISGTDEELKERFGKDWQDKKPFNWQKEFPEVFKQGGFDLVIGNPPYLLCQPQNTDRDTLSYYKEEYDASSYKIDLFHLFLERGSDLLKQRGVLGFITPNTYLMNKYTEPLRSLLLSTFQIKELVTFEENVFAQASVDTSIFIGQKTDIKDGPVLVNKMNSNGVAKLVNKIDQKHWADSRDKSINLNLTGNSNMRSDVLNLGELASVTFGLQTKDKDTFTSTEKKNKDWEPCVTGRDISRYYLRPPSLWFKNLPSEVKAGGSWDMDIHHSKKIVVRQVGGPEPIFAYDHKGVASLNTMYNIVVAPSSYSEKYILGVLNSQYIKDYWLEHFSDNKKMFPKIKGHQLKELPIPKASIEEQRKIAALVDKMLDLQKDLHDVPENSENWKKLKTELERTDKEIDEEISELYNLTAK